MLLDRGCTGEDQWIGIMDPLHLGSPGAGDCVVAFLIRAPSAVRRECEDGDV